MSVSGSRSIFLDTALALDDETADQFVRLPRNTLSAAPAHRASRGLQAVLVSFDRKVQHALRRLAFERMVLDARLKAETERMQNVEQNLYREPDVLERTRVALRDNDYNLRRLAGDAAPQIVAALADPAIQEALTLAVPTEDDTATETEARVWRRKLVSMPIPVRLDAPYRYAGHDSPTCKGSRDLHNILSSKTGEENFSYYQKQQLRYGKGRRGSTSIAGAWEDVFASNGVVTASNMIPVADRNNNNSNVLNTTSNSSSGHHNSNNQTMGGGDFGSSGGAGGDRNGDTRSLSNTGLSQHTGMGTTTSTSRYGGDEEDDAGMTSRHGNDRYPSPQQQQQQNYYTSAAAAVSSTHAQDEEDDLLAQLEAKVASLKAAKARANNNNNNNKNNENNTTSSTPAATTTATTSGTPAPGVSKTPVAPSPDIQALLSRARMMVSENATPGR